MTGAAALGRKQWLKNSVYTSLGALSYASAAPLWRGLDTHDLRVVMYHKVNDLAANSLTVPPDVFRRQMQILHAENNVITPEHLKDVLDGAATLPERPVLITFDDGYRDNATHAFPVLADLGSRALLFLATDFIDTTRTFPHDEKLSVPNPALTWAEANRIRSVFTLGSHGCSHRVLTTLPFETARAEIHDSKRVIEEKTGSSVDFFSYPKGSVGHFDDHLAAEVSAAGYTAAFVTIPGRNRSAELRPGHPVRRYNCEPVGPWTFRRLLDGSCDAIRLKDTQGGARVKRQLNRVLGTTTR
ncbi:MAG: polysaccharide deacetylase family protein [Frankiaceae bacterium]|nr:polysaccharide deacetylase family protein [Frankiaceae bacterium]